MSSTRPRGQAQVYPRVGGGNALYSDFGICVEGLSPRGRGKLKRAWNAGGRRRSIPAWAGETRPARLYRRKRGVYPRVGGGNCGLTAWSRRAAGLSPRGRGKRRRIQRDSLGARSIPAWAGETQRRVLIGGGVKVYPRVGGGNRRRRLWTLIARGLSPRGRGKQYLCVFNLEWQRSIPAWAGETITTLLPIAQVRVYPRVGGGNTQAKD